MNDLLLKITGTRPLLMHSDIMSDPLNKITKEHKKLTSVRKKTDEIQEDIAKSEWRGALYFDKDLGPFLPGINLEASIINGGKLSKMGAALKRGFEVVDIKLPLKYNGPREIEALWQKGFYDCRSVKVNNSRIVRYRPLFSDWEITASIVYDGDILDKNIIIKCATDAGAYIGVGDYRPKFGRFSVKEV